jgi:hypothetical protein
VLALAEDTPASPEGYHHVEVISPGGIELSFNKIGLARSTTPAAGGPTAAVE